MTEDQKRVQAYADDESNPSSLRETARRIATDPDISQMVISINRAQNSHFLPFWGMCDKVDSDVGVRGKTYLIALKV